MEGKELDRERKSTPMNNTQARPFSAATSKLAYAQAFTKPALAHTDMCPAESRIRHPLLASLRRLAHH